MVSEKRIFSVSAGQSLQGRDLLVQMNFDPSLPVENRSTLILGGVHGDEPASYVLVEEFAASKLARGEVRAPTIVWALLNPDGLERGTRWNARGVDLNRNCEFGWSADSKEPPGSHAWSEPENVALRELILRWRPAKIVTLHWALGELDADGAHSRGLLLAMWRALSPMERRPYRKRLNAEPHADALPGSLGSWCGFGLRYPDGTAPAIVTLELPAQPAEPRGEELPATHLDLVRARWQADAHGYLTAVRPGVEKMLQAACNEKM